ncbi:MAG: glycoside hydrolase family 127 protein, partial [Muribaculaceae bacterium]|nr:glycoside hydrolase family 127 protein [Muribaculaceae bacterium]
YSYADDLTPGWSVSVNGENVSGELRNGYMVVDRKWKKGDEVMIHFDMPARLVKAHDAVADDRGRVAVERGPLVYCAEWPDNDFCVHNVLLRAGAKPEAEPCVDLLGGVATVKMPVQTLAYGEDGRLNVTDRELKMIPYYAWVHRGEGDMAVWLPASLSAASAEAPVKTSREENGFFK